MSETLTNEQWVQRVLGVSFARTAETVAKPTVRFARAPVAIPPPARPKPFLAQGRARSASGVSPPKPMPSPEEFIGANGKKITIARNTQGGISYTAPPPPVGEVTFSGGGGKGVALPGAVAALEGRGILKGAKKIAGASVGSMTAALVAAGITATEFQTIADADETTTVITEGTDGKAMKMLWAAMKNVGAPLSGQGLEDVVRGALGATLTKRIEEYQAKAGASADPVVQQVLEEITSAKDGPTFLHLRKLSSAIPAIKEVVITGTYTEEFDEEAKPGKNGKPGNAKLKERKGGDGHGQLYVFDADSDPNLAIAKAVHASASFPGAFKPVDLFVEKLGYVVRFIDGGAMNNTPTSSSIGNERNLDPVPDQRGMTFVFQDEASPALKKGLVKPGTGLGAQIIDKVLNSENSAAEYAKNRDAADRPEDIVVVPMIIQLPPRKPGAKGKDGKSQIVDMSGLLDGTLKFSTTDQEKVWFAKAAEKATNEQIDQAERPKTRVFASDSQMFVSISMEDLNALQAAGLEGAQKAYEFRENVAGMIGKIRDAVKNSPDASMTSLAKDKGVTAAFDELKKLAGKDIDFIGYVGREMNKQYPIKLSNGETIQTSLDDLIAAVRKTSGAGSGEIDAMAATFAVADAVKVHSHADFLLKNVIYPKMKVQNANGTALEVMTSMEGLLRAAKTVDDLNLAIKIGVDHFKTKSDRKIPKRGHKKFAMELAGYTMKNVA
jgi:exoenzyme U